MYFTSLDVSKQPVFCREINFHYKNLLVTLAAMAVLSRKGEGGKNVEARSLLGLTKGAVMVGVCIEWDKGERFLARLLSELPIEY
jgi:hypothetical protein